MELNSDHPRNYAGSSTPFLDLMNDPAYATNTDDKGKGREFEEPDTCRICRGEGTEEEELFHPCKCSGSIKFVHQACLVEWLSHSQKKYCELCKTPFRFTKLYDPNMPKDLPSPLFIRQVLIHSFRTVLTWLRFVLVAFVWLGWLPWSMRAIWRALFWLADGRWSGNDSAQEQALGAAQLAANGTASVVGTLASISSAASAASQSVPTDSTSPQPSVSSMLSFASGEPLMLTIIKKAFSALFIPAMSSAGGPLTSNSSNVTTVPPRQRHPSWLSDVKFLNSLTPSPTINNILIDTLEGQLITLLVVISFILVFLIREWVVQQQPLANIADGEREAAVQLIANNRPNQQAEADLPQPQAPLGAGEFAGNEAHAHFGNLSDHEEEEPLPGSSTHFSNAQVPGSSRPAGALEDNSFPEDVVVQPYTQANQIWPGLDTFKDLWTRGNGDPEEVLRIIREEGRQDELGWVIAAMSRYQRSNSPRSIRDHAVLDEELTGTASSSNQGGANTHEDPPQPATGTSRPFAFSGVSGPASSADLGEHSWDTSSLSSEDHPSAGTSRRDFTFAMPVSGNENRGPHVTGSEEPPDGPASHNIITDPREEPIENTVVATEPTRPLPTESPVDHGPKTLADRAFDWFWGDITPAAQGQELLDRNEEHVAENPAQEAPFIAVQNDQRFAMGGAQDNPDIVPPADAGLDANDADAIEEGDDLEGILELIGMQGPIFGLLQNGVFSALLISFTVAVGIWLPYLWGKIALVLLANPIQLFFGVPMTAVSVIADITLDTLIGSFGYVMYWVSLICKLLLSPLGTIVPLGDWFPQSRSVTSASLSLIDASSHRLRKVVNAFFVFHESDLPMFSVLSHRALKLHEARIFGFLKLVYVVGKFVLHDLPVRILSHGLRDALSFDSSLIDFTEVSTQLQQHLDSLKSVVSISMPTAKLTNLDATRAASAQILADYDLAVWDTKDRVIAIIMGYMLASVLGLLYLRITGLLSGANRGQRIEGLVAEVLHQAGGVMKVILIIGIEMIVFPLYCGLLLDVALLPLFENASIGSRIAFTATSPLTSLFVHWFIGTCYMFHFALFVSMCRKVMRSGVLYFIRDPDDPTFHPVRDVLERNITTQLRKIAFSALVYGALVIVCLGGVVWGLHFVFDGVLPIHWTADFPALEFPAELLFYNFVLPSAIRHIKPSEALHGLYNWWFHKCARFLRLTDFFFGERRQDEEGHHVRRTWWHVLSGKKGDIHHPVIGPEQRALAEKQNLDAYFVRDGRFVRAPASDQVRIPKGSKVFVDVTETNDRVDGAPDPDDGLHGRANDMFTKVYIPPFFRVRIAGFIILIWAFAGTTGVGITVIPLVIGRKLISTCFASPQPMNDIYAFSIGLCIVGAVAYLFYYSRIGLSMAKDRLGPYLRSPRQALVRLCAATLQGIRLMYFFAAVVLLLPSLYAVITELYVLIPLHTYLGGGQGHIFWFVQDWTLGVLYVQMAVKLVLRNRTSRPAAAVNAVIRDGWLNPNVKLATRAFIIPIMLLVAVAVTVPLPFGFVLNSTLFRSSSDEVHANVYRYSYPVTFIVGLAMWLVHQLQRKVESWRIDIRDEVYLIGERLHNFSEKRAKDVGVPRRLITG